MLHAGEQLCRVQMRDSAGTGQLSVDLGTRQAAAAAATEVDFYVGYHNHKAVFADRGTFTAGSAINHNLTDGIVGVAWQGPQPHICTVQRVVLSNGKVLTP
jgi:hypothetical protein